MLLFFNYWTYVTMEITRKDVVFFSYWTYVTMEIPRKNVAFFSYWTYVTMEILRKNVFFFFGYWTYVTTSPPGAPRGPAQPLFFHQDDLKQFVLRCVK